MYRGVRESFLQRHRFFVSEVRSRVLSRFSSVISAPLSVLMCTGMHLVSMTSAIVSTTPKLLMRRASRIARHRKLVDQRHQPELALVVGLRLNEVVAPT